MQEEDFLSAAHRLFAERICKLEVRILWRYEWAANMKKLVNDTSKKPQKFIFLVKN